MRKKAMELILNGTKNKREVHKLENSTRKYGSITVIAVLGLRSWPINFG